MKSYLPNLKNSQHPKEQLPQKDSKRCAISRRQAFLKRRFAGN